MYRLIEVPATGNKQTLS